jgi:hypothetical protein
MTLILATAGFVLLAGMFLWWKFGRGPRLPSHVQARLRAEWDKARSREDLHRRILEADTVLSLLLDELGFRGTTGEKLKKAGTLLPDVNGVWHAHKLRNRIAHEPGTDIDQAKAAKAMRSFEHVIDTFCQ